MAVKDISSSKVKIYNPFGLYVTPFTSETTKGTTTYFLDEVIRDTTTISQEDPTESPTRWCSAVPGRRSRRSPAIRRRMW